MITYTYRGDLEFRRILHQFVKDGQTLPSSVCPQLQEPHAHVGEEALPCPRAPAPSAPRDPGVLLLPFCGHYPILWALSCSFFTWIIPDNELCLSTEGNGQPLTRAPQTTQPSEGEWGGFAAPGEFAVGWTTGDGAVHFPSTAAKHVNACYTLGSAGTWFKLSTRLNTLLSD